MRSRERQFIRLGPAPDEEGAKPPRAPVDRYVNHQTAALWLRGLWPPASDPSWLTDFVAAYEDWTFVANGAGLDEREEVTERPDEWNRVFFAVFAESMCRWLDGMRTTRPGVIKAARAAIGLLLAKLVAVGVAEAHALEIAMNASE